MAVPLDKVGGKARRQRQASTPCIFMVGFILREPQSTTANFLENVGEGRAVVVPRQRYAPWVGYVDRGGSEIGLMTDRGSLQRNKCSIKYS